MNRLQRFRTLALILAAACLACGSPPPVTSKDFAAGPILQQTDPASLRRLLGEPREVTRATYSWDKSREFTTWSYPGLSLDLLGDRAVTGILLTEDRFSTPRGLRVGDNAARVLKLHGSPYRVDGSPYGGNAYVPPPSAPGTAWTYCQPRDAVCLHALTVEFGENDEVARIFLGWRR